MLPVGRMYEGCPAFADPIPTAQEFIDGIPHKSTDTAASGALGEVLRAMHSRKMHYYTILKDEMELSNLKFKQAFPDLGPASGGTHPLSEDGWRRLTHAWKFNTTAVYVKHMLTKHGGELCSVGNEVWELFPASGGNHRKACFWHYQFATMVAESNQDAVIQ